ncbi:pilus assembly protein PilM [Proteinivorax hydrogeniformans]|uniref:Pilus assembly protein PilM n=1 Tax=Proteinivorax hydrogeniformans TaxID=1826727 RepID=A0AAU8HQY7_9FIRM
MLLLSQKKLVGIDIGQKMTKIAYKNKEFAVETPEGSVGRGGTPNPSILGERLKQVVSENGLAKKFAVISYNGQGVFTKVIQVPKKLKLSEVNNYIQLQKDNILPFGTEDSVMDFIQLGSDDNHQNILVLALKQKSVHPYYEAVKIAGLRPKVVDIPALALKRKYFDKENLEGLQLIVDVGERSTNIHIYKEKQFRFSRSITVGGADFGAVASAAKEMTAKEGKEVPLTSPALADVFYHLQRELNRSIEYFRYRSGKQELTSFTLAYITGGYGKTPGLDEVFAQSLDIPLESIISDDSKYSLAQGLTMWGDGK